ncbi:tumor necrosis factor receptor superfamily member 9b [Tachysurus fulvidraco]|uniref:tumor necrosis factor receptor superfamily member 9b n=1 Tax=Tachysurus fulvidraco TaxID=1234273 RepID=UPI001FEEA7DA|nr:tumor necrosis factor receptor superfamily member 9b [Tachysurus fulvidraco]
MWLLLTLLLSLSMGSHEVEPGCDKLIRPPSSTEYCCVRCKPGNRLVKTCDSNKEVLCTPCENGTYTRTNTEYCKRCTECISPLKVKTFCTASSDTVCECAEGFQCGDETCSFCVQQCGKGEEPTDQRDCQPCPAGTFNSQIHHHCIKWSSSCPSADQQIVAEGTAVSDIVCAEIKPTVPNEIPSNPDSKDPGMKLVMAIICACLIVSSAMPLCMAMYFKKEKTEKTPLGPVETPAARLSLVPELEQCTFCFPQEEHGSNSSLLLDDKPFELVV